MKPQKHYYLINEQPPAKPEQLELRVNCYPPISEQEEQVLTQKLRKLQRQRRIKSFELIFHTREEVEVRVSFSPEKDPLRVKAGTADATWAAIGLSRSKRAG